MKLFRFLTIFSILVSGPLYAQYEFEEEGVMEEELETGEAAAVEHGGYGAPVVKLTRMNETDGVLNGVKGAWIVDHNLALGGAVYGLVNNVNFPGFQSSMDFVYGGIQPEYIYSPLENISLSAGILLGAGVVDFDDNPNGSDGVFIAEPEVNVMFRVTKNFKLALNGGYRAVSGVDLPTLSNNKVSGFSYGLSLNFGEF